MRVLTVDQMVNALTNYGAVVVVVNANGFPGSPAPKTQVITCAPIYGPNDNNLDHTVVVVGWQSCQVRAEDTFLLANIL